MRVLVLSAMYPKPSDLVDGIFIHQRVVQLIEKGHEVFVYSPLPYPFAFASRIKKFKRTYEKLKDIHRKGGYRHLGVRVIPLWYFGRPDYLISALQIAFKLLRIVKANRIDVVHSHFGFPSNVAASLVKGKCVVKTYHGSDINIIAQKNSLTRALIRYSLSKQINVFVSNSLHTRAEKICSNIKNAFVIPNGVSACFFENGIKAKREERLLGFIGRLEAVKGFDRFIKIINRSELSNFSAIVVGEGSMKALIGISKTVEYSQFVDQNKLAEILDRVGILLMPSRNEGWPCLILEAYSRGAIVLATNVGGVPEIITNGSAMVDSELSEQLLVDEFVDKVLETHVREEEQNALRSRASSYTWSSIVDKEITLYGG